MDMLWILLPTHRDTELTSWSEVIDMSPMAHVVQEFFNVSKSIAIPKSPPKLGYMGQPRPKTVVSVEN